MSILPERRCTSCGEIKPASEFSPHKGGVGGLRAQCKACRRAQHAANPDAKREADRRYRETKRGQPRPQRDIPPEKQCKVCGEVKSAADFDREHRNRDGLMGMCRACRAAQSAAHYAANADAVKARVRAYAQEHADKVKVIAQRAYQRRKADPQFAERRRQHKRHYAATNREKIRTRENAYYWRDPDRWRNYHNRRNARQRANEGSFTAEEWEALCARYGYRCLACGERKPLTIDHVVPVSKGGSSYISNLQPLCHACNSRKHDDTIDYRVNSPYEVK